MSFVTSAIKSTSVRIEAANCRTAFGDATATCAALLAGRCALELRPVFGKDGGDAVPLALAGGRSFDETAPPNWAPILDALAAEIPRDDWGSSRRPVFVTSSNFGVGNFYAFQRTRAPEHLTYGPPFACVEFLRARLGWGENITILSHACVSAHLGLLLAGRTLTTGLADRALVFSFDFISPFVTGGFHALKILNAGFPAPYAARATGSIGLADGAAFAVLSRDEGRFSLTAHSLYNEMSHFTANRADGTGFAACLSPLADAADGQRVWVKGHGTGTLEAGRLEAETLARVFPESPLVSWKGGLGHTLGSCGLVELAVALAALKGGRTPGTVGATAPFFTAQVVAEPFDNVDYNSVLLVSNAFGGAHAACLLRHV
jgi:Beta-ketoacyl synthase, C-terminal domain